MPKTDLLFIDIKSAREILEFAIELLFGTGDLPESCARWQLVRLSVFISLKLFLPSRAQILVVWRPPGRIAY